METDLKTRLAQVQEELFDVSIKYQNLKDRQSFKTIGITAGIALLFIGIILGHTWTMRIVFVIVAGIIILGAIYGIKKVDHSQLETLANQVTLKQDQIVSLKKAIKLQQAENKNNEH